MPWIKIRGVTGRLWMPEEQDGSDKKHACKDCDYCQMCSDIRCDKCRRISSKKKRD